MCTREHYLGHETLSDNYIRRPGMDAKYQDSILRLVARG
jgi:hypothetical protein